MLISPLIDVMILAAVALFVLWRLYVALGTDEGAKTRHRDPARYEPRKPEVDAPAPAPAAPAEASNIAHEPVFTGPGAAGLEEIYRADNSFNPSDFLRGAKEAYKMIVGAFASGDRTALRPLLDDDVYEAWDAAITARQEKDERPFELLRLKSAEIDSAGLDDQVARIVIRYESELGDGERVRRAREMWTFMRDVTSSDPNWVLDDVETAN